MSDLSPSESEWTEDNSAYRQQQQAALAAVAQCINLFAKLQDLVKGWVADLDRRDVRRMFNNYSLEEWLACTEGILDKMTLISEQYSELASLDDDNNALAAKEEVDKTIEKGQQLSDLIKQKMKERQQFLKVSNRLSEAQKRLEDLQARKVARRQKIRLQFEKMHQLQGRVRILYKIRPKNEQQLCQQKKILQTTPEKAIPQVILWKSPFQIQLRKKTQSIFSKGKFIYSYEAAEVDYCFQPKVQQAQIFHYLEYMVDSVFKGQDYCLFSYGQSGTGKTYSMVGPQSQISNYKLHKDSGIVQRAFNAIFQRIQQAKGKRQLILDLSIKEAFATQEEEGTERTLSQSKQSKNRQNQEKLGKNSFRKQSHSVRTYEAAMKIVSEALAERKNASTKQNHTSSRSHFLIGLTLVEGYMQRKKVGSLCMIDLAGNQRQEGGEKSLQTTFINKTLSNLGKCLRDLKKYRFPAWRDCSFLAMLQPYLEESKVVAIITLSPKSNDDLSNKRSVKFGSEIKK